MLEVGEDEEHEDDVLQKESTGNLVSTDDERELVNAMADAFTLHGK